MESNSEQVIKVDESSSPNSPMNDNQIEKKKRDRRFRRIQVQCDVHIDLDTILQSIRESMKQIKFFAESTTPQNDKLLHEFYVKGPYNTETVCKIITHLGEKFLVTSTIENPPRTARDQLEKVPPGQIELSPDANDRLKLAIRTRFNPETGHLNLSSLNSQIISKGSNTIIKGNFGNMNKRKFRRVLDEIILKEIDVSKIVSLDLSHNNLTYLKELTFLHTANYKIVYLNHNKLPSASQLSMLRSTAMTELSVRNNPFTESSGRPSNYVMKVHNLFPNLLTLDSEAIGPLLRAPTLSRSAEPGDLDPPCKIPRFSSGLESSSSPTTLFTPMTKTIDPTSIPQVNHPVDLKRDIVDESGRKMAVLENQLKASTKEIRQLKEEMRRMKEMKVENDQLKVEIHRMKGEHERDRAEIRRIRHDQDKTESEIRKLKDQVFFQQWQNNAETQRKRQQHDPYSNTESIVVEPPAPHCPAVRPGLLPLPPIAVNRERPRPNKNNSRPISGGSYLDDMSHLFYRPHRQGHN